MPTPAAAAASQRTARWTGAPRDTAQSHTGRTAISLRPAKATGLSADAARTIRDEVPGAIVGLGTVLTPADLEHALATNVLGPFRLTKALLGALASSAREGRGAVVLNISSDAAINAYPRWGAYGVSKAALHHLSRIWNEELASQGIAFLSLDPGDMDTPLHAAAVPDADPTELKRPEISAVELVDAIGNLLSFMNSERVVEEVAR